MNTTSNNESSVVARCGAASATTPPSSTAGGRIAFKFTPATTSAFFSAYLALGVPFTVAALCAAFALFRFLRWRLDRTVAHVSARCTCTQTPDVVGDPAKHARCVYWLGRAVQAAVLSPLALLVGWGAMTLSIPGADVVGIAILLLFTAFFLLAWTTAAWSANSYAFNFGGSSRKTVPIFWGSQRFSCSRSTDSPCFWTTLSPHRRSWFFTLST